MKLPRIMRRRGEAAFTMVEIALSIAIVAFAMVAIIGVLPTGLNVQRDNREDTIINQDAAFLMECLRSGSFGLTTLTNNLEIIEYTTLAYNAGNLVSSNRVYLSNLPPAQAMNYLTHPYYLPGGNPTNYLVRMKLRAFSGPLGERGTNRVARDFAFTYRLTTEIKPFDVYNTVDTTFSTNLATPADVIHYNNYVLARQREFNLYEVLLTFEWPVFPDPSSPMGRAGNGRQTFRTMMGGFLTNEGGVFHFRPSIYQLAP